MARPKKQPQFKAAGFDQAVRALFIIFGWMHNSHALRLLARISPSPSSSTA